MQTNAFEEKLYTSTEVAEILGVSLRSIYRYLEENKIQAAVKTATGRHRFTKQNINDFLHPSTVKSPHTSVATDDQDKAYGDTIIHRVTKEVIEEEVDNSETLISDSGDNKVLSNPKNVEHSLETEIQDEPIDWLARFRQAAEKYKTQDRIDTGDTNITTKEELAQKSEPEPVIRIDKVRMTSEIDEEPAYKYYRSGVGGLKEIAQSLDKSAKNASIDYAFTMSAGLSLHKPIKPFSLIHAYVRSQDLAYFEKVLQLSSCQKDTAQLCLISSDNDKLYTQGTELHGLYVVSDAQIKADLTADGELELANELD